MENRPLVKFIRNYIRDSSGVFSISSLVRISITSFPTLTLSFVQKYSCPYNKRKLHGGLKIGILFSWEKKKLFYSLAALVCKILFLPLENRIHVFALPCNILYLSTTSCPKFVINAVIPRSFFRR